MKRKKTGKLNHEKIRYYLLLLGCLCCPAVIKLSHFDGASGVVLMAWIYLTLDACSHFRDRKQVGLTGGVFVFGFCMMYLGAMGNIWVSLLVFAFFGACLFAAIFGTAAGMRKWNRFASTLILPAVWLVVYLLLTAVRFPTIVRVDALFTDMSALMYIESWIGEAGLICVLLWLVTLVRYAHENRKIGCAALAVGIAFLLALPGIIRLYPNMEAAESLRVAYTTGPYAGDFVDYFRVDYDACEASLEQSVRNAAQQKAEVLVFNEEAFEMDDTSEARFLERCAQLAKENAIAVLVGLDIKDTDNSEGGKAVNEIVLIGSDGSILETYRKSCLIPFMESAYVPGDGTVPSRQMTINGKNVKIAFLICYDSNFASYVNQMDADTDILFLPSWDWAAVTDLHAEICRTIAVRNQVFVLKPTYDGLSVAIDQDGRVFHSSTTDETGFEQIHIVEMPIKSTAKAVPHAGWSSLFVPAIIGTELLSVGICLVLLAGNRSGSKHRTKRSLWFSILTIGTMTGCFSDAMSWLLDGSSRLNSAVFVFTMVSMIMTLVLSGVFVIYLTEYVKERRQVSNIPLIISWVFVAISVTATIIAGMNGSLFTCENGVYADGPLYPWYVIVNAAAMLIGLFMIGYYRKALGTVDRGVCYLYMMLPMISALVNVFCENWSFAYPAIMLSQVIVYVMIQTDQMVRLESRERIENYYATHDTLTGLQNRRAYQNHLALLKGMDGACGVIFSDLNGLKYTNDNFGHEAGDTLLKSYADILLDNFRMTETFRISGDEFICILSNLPEETFLSRTRNLEEILARDEMPLACIGAVFGPCRDADRLVREAETKMYAEKERVHAQFQETKRT